ncbi:MAG: hypothetical protein LC648_02810 [Novosphingobium sp.]|nr:hypothetical protein [Novosphingobium sp.]
MLPRSNPPRVALALLACLLAAGCFLLPGKFASELTLRNDGTFAFAYRGDVHVLALSKMAQDEMGEDAKFEPVPCYDDNTGDERPCSADEISVQRSDWATQQEAARAKRREDAEMMRKMLGGIDPADPRAAEELAERMRKQAGWRSVTYVGDGKFVVDFAIAGRLDHDFSFPTVEKMPVATPFVAVFRRADGSVRVDAPAFAANTGGGPMAGMASGLADKEAGGGVPKLDGTFAVITDGEILANNTDDGPQAGAAGLKRLSWKVTPRTVSAPTALIKLER